MASVAVRESMPESYAATTRYVSEVLRQGAEDSAHGDLADRIECFDASAERRAVMFKRSEVRVAAIAALVILIGALLLSCGSSNNNPVRPPTTDSKQFTSTVVAGHSHRITIQKSELETPPSGGISRTTTSDGGHTHSFAMSEAQLTAAKTGPVVITTGSASGHTHDFTIQKWY